MLGTEFLSWHPCGFLVYLSWSLVFTSCDWLQWLLWNFLPWNLLVWNVTIVSEVESSRPSHLKRNYVNTLDNQEGPFSIPEACEVRLFHESFSANTSLLIHPWVDENRGHLKRKATFSQRTCLVKNIENKLEGVFGSTLLGLVASVCTPQPTRTPQLPTLLAQAT